VRFTELIVFESETDDTSLEQMNVVLSHLIGTGFSPHPSSRVVVCSVTLRTPPGEAAVARLLLDMPPPEPVATGLPWSARQNMGCPLVLYRLGDTRARGRVTDTRGAADELGHVHSSMAQSLRGARSFSLPGVRTSSATELGVGRA